MPIKDKKTYNQYMRDYGQKKKRAKILTHGGKCKECKEARIEFLTLARRNRKTIVLCYNHRFVKKISKVEESIKT